MARQRNKEVWLEQCKVWCAINKHGQCLNNNARPNKEMSKPNTHPPCCFRPYQKNRKRGKSFAKSWKNKRKKREKEEEKGGRSRGAR